MASLKRAQRPASAGAIDRRRPSSGLGHGDTASFAPLLKDLFVHYDLSGDGRICPEALASTQCIVRALVAGLDTEARGACSPGNASVPASSVLTSVRRSVVRTHIVGVGEQHGRGSVNARLPAAATRSNRVAAEQAPSFAVVGVQAAQVRVSRHNVELQVAAPERSPSLVSYGEAALAEEIVNFDGFLLWQERLLAGSATSAMEKRQRLYWLVSELNKLDAASGRRQFWQMRHAVLQAHQREVQEVQKLVACGDIVAAVEQLDASLKRMESTVEKEFLSVRDGERLAAQAVAKQKQYMADLQVKAREVFLATLEVDGGQSGAALESKLKAVPSYVHDEELAPYLERLKEMRKPFNPSITTLAGSYISVEACRLDTIEEFKKKLGIALSTPPYRIGIANSIGDVLTKDAKILEDYDICDASIQLTVVLGPVQRFREMSDDEFNELLVQSRIIQQRHLPGPLRDDCARMKFRSQYIPRLEAIDTEKEQQRERQEEKLRRQDCIAAEAKQWIDQLGAGAAEEITHKTAQAEVAAATLAQQHMTICDGAQRDLDQAVPSLENAYRAIDNISKADVCECRSFARPPRLVVTTLEAVLILLGEKPIWANAKVVLSDCRFMERLVQYDKDGITAEQVQRLQPFLDQEDFVPDVIRNQSALASALCSWVRAMCTYFHVAQALLPIRAALREHEEHLEDAMIDSKTWQHWASCCQNSAHVNIVDQSTC